MCFPPTNKRRSTDGVDSATVSDLVQRLTKMSTRPQPRTLFLFEPSREECAPSYSTRNKKIWIINPQLSNSVSNQENQHCERAVQRTIMAKAASTSHGIREHMQNILSLNEMAYPENKNHIYKS